MVDINYYKIEKSCVYKGEKYLVRDNGAVLRKPASQKRTRKYDNVWTFGKPNSSTGYLEISSVPVHRIVARAFHGEPPTKHLVVDHIDTNRQNNRPDNLRWVTRLENVVLNPVTRKRIEYRTKVDIYDFLKDPSKYKDAFKEPDFAWMRAVTEEEAAACLENVRRWSNDKTESCGDAHSRIGEWIYEGRASGNKTSRYNNADEEEHYITDSLTPLAKQQNWKTPTEFVCCPASVEGEPISWYGKNLSPDAVFSANQFGESKVVKYAVANDAVFVITLNEQSHKPFALARIIYRDGYYIHASEGAYFSFEGAEKRFALAQGLQWDGEDSIDDYC